MSSEQDHEALQAAFRAAIAAALAEQINMAPIVATVAPAFAKSQQIAILRHNQRGDTVGVVAVVVSGEKRGGVHFF